MTKPTKPETMNGDHEALWKFMLHLNARIDRILWTMIGLLATTAGLLLGFILEVTR